MKKKISIDPSVGDGEAAMESAGRLRRERSLPVGYLILAYWLLCVLVTHLPPSKIPSVRFPGLDTIIHFLMYSGLGFLLARYFRDRWGVRTGRLPLAVLCILLVYATVDELTQPWTQRTASLGDWSANLAGATTGVLLFIRFIRRRGRTPRSDG